TRLCRRLPTSPCQKTRTNALADEFYAEQYANEPDRGDGNVGPKIESQENPDDPARQDPTPVRKGPYRQRKNHLRNTLDHEEHNQQKRERNEALRRVAKKQYPEHHEQDNRDKLKPEMRHMGRTDETNALQDT